MLRTRLRQQC